MPSAKKTPARRVSPDPEKRRLQIVQAAAELIIESGSLQLTHRKIAAQAQVPLGSTTQYFATLDDIRSAAMQYLADKIDGDIAEFQKALESHGPSAVIFADMYLPQLRDRQTVRAETAFICAAVTNKDLRVHALRWFEGLVEALEPHIGRDNATAVGIFADGVTVHAALNDAPIDRDLLIGTLNALMHR
ncbi:TetR/AcrR family transcriptional regulator [Mycolicibacterium sp. HK-90]|uniref:TetR/AcrR family transcriptional regulator n=1 Tax=Mycolicibacterium sp. HK-90 TaxID=3056937 RepID=UPI00265B46A8|nr:TetR family transcriptional regulator [Mycolicibacterium sp. HK-90]WKG03915.1 TetR family transcriptional regulator [Mycolicibacterium sp. HK-90]